MNIFDKYLNTEEKRRNYHNGWVRFLFTEAICGYMKDHGISRTALAKRLNKTKAHVSQVLDEESNMTIGTLADIVYALNCELQLDLIDKAEGKKGESEGDWQVEPTSNDGFLSRAPMPKPRLVWDANQMQKSDWEQQAANSGSIPMDDVVNA